MTTGKYVRTPEFRQKMSEIKRAQKNKWTDEQREKTLKARQGKYKSGENHWNWNGGKHIKEGYVWVLTDEFYSKKSRKKYFQEHRLVMEKKLGRKLKKNEEVHHKNGIKTDNRESNLEIVLNNNHFGKVCCPYCSKDFKIK
jgi:hypothetical protein